jgi:hypothetical protein
VPELFLNPKLPNYFQSAPEVVTASDARSYVTEYEAGRVIYFPNFKPQIDCDFWANLNTDKYPFLKKFGIDLNAKFDNLDLHRKCLIEQGLDKHQSGAICQQIAAVYRAVLPVYLSIFSDYSFDRQKVMWRLNTIMAENMHIDTYKDEIEHHFARMFVNLDAHPRIWHTSWHVDDMIRQAVGNVSPEKLDGLTRGDVWLKLNRAFFGKTSRDWWDDQPRHAAFFAPGDVWIVDSRQVAHQIFYGRRALSIDFFVPKRRMKNPDRHYLNIAERFRLANRLAAASL